MFESKRVVRIVGALLVLSLILAGTSFAADDLTLRLFSSTHGSERLGDFLLPLRDGDVFEGCVVQLNRTPAVNAKTITFSFDQFLADDAATVGSDGDFIFYIQLDPNAQRRLQRHVAHDVAHLLRNRALTHWPQFDFSVLHVEAVAYARSLLDKSTVLFPGWRESSSQGALLLNGNSVVSQLTCALFDTSGRCAEPRLNGSSLIGSRVRATGLLAIDCNDFGVVAGCPQAGRELELHPVYSLEITGTCK